MKATNVKIIMSLGLFCLQLSASAEEYSWNDDAKHSLQAYSQRISLIEDQQSFLYYRTGGQLAIAGLTGKIGYSTIKADRGTLASASGAAMLVCSGVLATVSANLCYQQHNKNELAKTNFSASEIFSVRDPIVDTIAELFLGDDHKNPKAYALIREYMKAEFDKQTQLILKEIAADEDASTTLTKVCENLYVWTGNKWPDLNGGLSAKLYTSKEAFVEKCLPKMLAKLSVKSEKLLDESKVGAQREISQQQLERLEHKMSGGR